MIKPTMKRVNVTFPEGLLADLDRLVPPRKRNEVIVAATREKLRRLRTLAALRDSAGAWSDAAHPELATPEAIDCWLRESRASWRSSRDDETCGEGSNRD